LRILVVEDEQIIAEDLTEKVTRMGHLVVGCAITAEEAVDVAAQSKPDLVLMDIQLAGKMNGAEAAHIIQDRVGSRIVFITAFPRAYLNERTRMRHPGLCLTKPISRIQLEAALRAAEEPPSIDGEGGLLRRTRPVVSDRD
jgi:CheY-like chemotaxis protein